MKIINWEQDFLYTRIFKKWDVGVRTGLDWLRIVTGGGRL
jgi:hypothetical protein